MTPAPRAATVQNSTISGNNAQVGGGIENASGEFARSHSTAAAVSSSTATVTASTISGNTGTQQGGGINADGTSTVTNSTITGNTSPTGGGIYAESNSTLTLTNDTVARNSSTSDGANFYSDDASAGGIQNTIFAYPQTSDDAVTNCDTGADFPPDKGNNLSSDLSTCWEPPGKTSDQLNTDPKLGPLANNGGPTQTEALLAGSPAIDHAATISSITTDQRGGPRPQPPGGKYDIGAYEYGAVVDMGITKTASPSPAKVGGTVTYTLKAANDGPSLDPAFDVVVKDSLPSGVTFKSASTSQGSCSNSSGTVTCHLGTIGHGATATVTIKVKADKAGKLTNTATVSSSALDPTTANNSAKASVKVHKVKPKATTGAASGISSSSATVHGRVNPEGSSTTYYFEYGTTKQYGKRSSSGGAGSGSSFHSVSQGLSGLKAGTVYHYRIVAHNAHGTAFGLDRTFKTPAAPAFTG